MLICPKCKQEMHCQQNGVIAVWNKHHCRSGDLYECIQCRNQVLLANENAFYSDGLINKQYRLDMD